MRLEQLILAGKFDGEPLDFLQESAKTNPEQYLQIVRKAIDLGLYGMVPTALAIFISEGYKSPKLLKILGAMDANRLFEICDLLRSKGLKSGLGSRAQKMIRATMEGWSLGIIKVYSATQKESLKLLVKWIHPRFNDNRGIIIKNILINSNF